MAAVKSHLGANGLAVPDKAPAKVTTAESRRMKWLRMSPCC
jgi:hypothetical protein